MNNLSYYVDKEVTITLENGASYVGTIKNLPFYVHSYGFYNLSENFLMSFGIDGKSMDYTRKHIKTIKVNKPEHKESLDSTTLNNIAQALTPAAIKYIESHEKYAEVMQALIIEFVEKNLGDLNGELPFMIFDKMFLNRSR
jgi:hypothetical protein